MILEELNYTTIHGVSVYIPFFDRITVIGGDSSSGKSFVKDTAKEAYNDIGVRIIEVFDYSSPVDLDMLKNLSGRLIIMDNADIFLRNDLDLRTHINRDGRNQYLLFMRTENGIDASADNYAELHEEGLLRVDKKLIAYYPYR